MPWSNPRRIRLLVALSGVVGVIVLTAHFFIPPNPPPDTSTLAQLTAYGPRNHDALLVSAFIIAAVKASSSHPTTAIVSYDLIVGPDQ